MTSHRGIAWQADALCVDAPTELFFPDVRAGSNPHRSVGPVAKLWCAQCPVREQCGGFADRMRLDGLWGGVWRTLGVQSSYTRLPLIPDARPGGRRGIAAARRAEHAATVQQLTADGLPTRQIAARLDVSERTVQRLRGRAS